MHRSQGATALLGMEEFVVGAQVDVDDEVWMAVETKVDVAACEGCGTRAIGHGRRETRVRDLPAGTDRWCWCGESASGDVSTRTAT